MEHLDTHILITLIVVLLLLSAIFSSSETAIFSIDRLRLKTDSDKGHRTAQRLSKLIENPEKALSFILICNNLVNIAASALVTLLTIRLFGEPALAYAIGLLTIVVLIFAEITPKTFAAIRPEPIAFAIAWIYPPLIKILTPVLSGMRAITSLLLWPFKSHLNQAQQSIGSDQLRTLLTSPRIQLSDQRRQILLNTLDFEKLLVEDVMIPRLEIQGIDLCEEWDKVLLQIKMHPHSDILFYRESFDKIEGACDYHSLYNLLIENRLNFQTLVEKIKPPLYTVEGTRLISQIKSFRQTPDARFALVLNEYDTVQGLLTRGDALKRIDPGYNQIESTMLRPERPNTYLADAAMRVEDLNKMLKLELPTNETQTLNGLITNHLESIPKTSISTRISGVTFEIVKAVRSQIQTVRIIVTPPPNERSGS